MKPKLFYTSLTGPVALYFYTFSGLDEPLFGLSRALEHTLLGADPGSLSQRKLSPQTLDPKLPLKPSPYGNPANRSLLCETLNPQTIDGSTVEKAILSDADDLGQSWASLNNPKP